jgi:uncharacterized protein (DUF1810 family)
VGIVLGVEGRTVAEIFGYPDDLKFHSSMTLFAKSATQFAEVEGSERNGVFEDALAKYFGGVMDQGTVARI